MPPRRVLVRVGMDTVSEIFKELGGSSRVARILGVGQSTASMMKHRGFIPVDHWPRLVESREAKRLGISAEVLMRVNARRSQSAGVAAE